MPWITLNQKDGANEILMYEPIGRDPWSDEGLTAKDFKAVLDKVESGKDLTIRINSKGGDVYEGFTIRNLLDSWKGKVSVIIDGVAASTASWIGLGADEIKAAKNSQMFIHDAIAFGFGNAAELTKQAERLNITSDQIAQMYADKTGKPQSEMRDLMRKETLLTAEDAVKLGLIDGLTDSSAISNFSDADINAMKARLRTMNQTTTAPSAGKPKEMHSMSDTKTGEQPAALNKLPDPPKPSAENKGTDAVVLDMLNAFKGELASLREENKSLREREDATRKQRIENAVDELVRNDQIVLAIRDSVINRAMKDETILDDYRKLAPKPPGAEPVKPLNIEANASAVDIARAFRGFNAASESWRRGNDVASAIIGKNALEKGAFFNTHRAKLMELCSNYEGLRVLNAAGDNTLPAGLQVQVILQEMIRAYAKKLIALNVFSTVFSNIALQGTDKINVPFYDLETAASTDWNAANGYVIGTTTTDTREITINKRKYQALSVTSSLYRRQPFYNMMQLLTLKAEKLGVDVFTDVLSVVTATNFGDPVLTKDPALIDGDDITAIRTACNKADWPEVGRALIVNADVDGALLADPTIKSQGDFGVAVQQTGKLPNLRGFDYLWNSNIPTNSENLIGMAVHRSAILVATSPIEPHPNVRANLAAYEVVTDPSTGISFEYRSDADTAHDIGRETVEANYGYAKGYATALKRITSA